MKKINKEILYFEHSPNNKPVEKVDQNEWFEVETQKILFQSIVKKENQE